VLLDAIGTGTTAPPNSFAFATALSLTRGTHGMWRKENFFQKKILGGHLLEKMEGFPG